MARTAATLVTALALAYAPTAAAQRLGRLVETGEVPWPDAVIGQPTPLDGARPAAVGVLRSHRAPVSVHVGAGVDVAVARAALEHATRSLDALEFTHGFEGPQPDGLRGGDPSLDVYVTADGPALATEVDALDVTGLWDRASAFVRVRTTADPEALRRRVAEGVARALVLGAKADHPASVVSALGASLARLATGMPADLEALRRWQRAPARALFDAPDDEAARGAGMVFDLVTARWDDGRHPILRGLMAAPVQRTPPGWRLLWDEPDLFDVARRAFRDEHGRLEGALLDVCAARALVGTRADAPLVAGALDPTLATAPQRVVRYAELPRWVPAVEPLAPTGCATLALDLADAPLGATAAVWFHGSPWQRWMARVVRVGGDGRAAGPVDSDVIADGEWSTQLDLLDGYTRAWLVVVNLGDLTYEPDVPPSANGFFAVHFGRGGR